MSCPSDIPAKKSHSPKEVAQIADKVRFVLAGCGVNALSGLQNSANSINCRNVVGLISAAHQAMLRLSSVLATSQKKWLFTTGYYLKPQSGKSPHPLFRCTEKAG
ncbi:hypothetical protein FHD46_01260 [Escherichia coli]|nr:hypothetical protein C1192_12375 [Escherichia marmotae]EEV6993037.1 hypothetical protein [Escherichia coli]PSY68187.1 hypothetical protein C7B16_02615 [Escherichia sp. 20412-1]EFA4950163.1 hypothetical protein [Escherichia coli]EFB2834051.1 hypothetical protein [Escherichia coli]